MGEEPRADAFSLYSDEELRAAYLKQEAALARAQAIRFAVIREIDRRPGFVPGARAGTEAKTYLRMMRAETPDDDVRMARALDRLPRLAGALAAAEVARGHVKIVERTVRTIREAENSGPFVLSDARTRASHLRGSPSASRS